MNRLSGIHFLDGPAKRVELQLRRAPLMLRVTPAMEAGLSTHVWEIEELFKLIG